MTWITKTRVKYALAGAGVLYIALFVGYLVYAGTKPTLPSGPTELEAHPEKQAEIVARRRAEELRDQLQLNEEQTQKIAAILLKYEAAPSTDGDPRNRWRAQREAIEQVLTPEQTVLWEQQRGQFRGPGGPGGFGGPAVSGGPSGTRMPGVPATPTGPRAQFTPERIEQLKQSMTPEQQQRFDKAMQRMQQMRQGRGGRGSGRGPGPVQRPPQR